MILNKVDCINLYNLLVRAKVEGLDEAQVLVVLAQKLKAQVEQFDAPPAQVPMSEPALDIPPLPQS